MQVRELSLERCMHTRPLTSTLLHELFADSTAPPVSRQLQQYLPNPLLLPDGHKIDLRLFVAVTWSKQLVGGDSRIQSDHGWAAHICTEGLVRRAVRRYSAEIPPGVHRDLHVQARHFTNISVHARLRDAVDEAPKSEAGSEALPLPTMMLSHLWPVLEARGISPAEVWRGIKRVVAEALRRVESRVLLDCPQLRLSEVRSECGGGSDCVGDDGSFRAQLIGVDVLLDHQGRPWLLEMNARPHMRLETEPWYTSLLADTVSLCRSIAGAQHIPALAEAERLFSVCAAWVAVSAFEPLENATALEQHA